MIPAALFRRPVEALSQMRPQKFTNALKRAPTVTGLVALLDRHFSPGAVVTSWLKDRIERHVRPQSAPGLESDRAVNRPREVELVPGWRDYDGGASEDRGAKFPSLHLSKCMSGDLGCRLAVSCPSRRAYSGLPIQSPDEYAGVVSDHPATCGMPHVLGFLQGIELEGCAVFDWRTADPCFLTGDELNVEAVEHPRISSALLRLAVARIMRVAMAEALHFCPNSTRGAVRVNHVLNCYTYGMKFPVSLRPSFTTFKNLTDPAKVQDFLDSMPINFETNGDTFYSPLLAIRNNTAHCLEGAVLAAAALWYHGHKPLLMDLMTTDDDESHVVALFKGPHGWGTISKTNHPVLRYRDPIYASVRELALSYFNEYFLDSGKKTLRTYSKPLNLSKNADWLTDANHLWWINDVLDDADHFYVIPPEAVRSLRKADQIEIKATKTVEWKSLEKH